MFGEDEAVAREQQQRRTRGQQSWAKAKAGESCLGLGLGLSACLSHRGLGLERFTPASTQAQIFRVSLSLLGMVGAVQAGEYIRSIWYHSPQVSGLIRYSGPLGIKRATISLNSRLLDKLTNFFWPAI